MHVFDDMTARRRANKLNPDGETANNTIPDGDILSIGAGNPDRLRARPGRKVIDPKSIEIEYYRAAADIDRYSRRGGENQVVFEAIGARRIDHGGERADHGASRHLGSGGRQ